MSHFQSFEVGDRVILTMDGGEAVIKGSSAASQGNLIGQATVSHDEGGSRIEGRGSVVLNIPNRVHLSLEGEPNNVVVRDLRHLSLDTVEGNLVARHVGTLQVNGALEGEVALSQIEQPLTLESVQGNLAIREVSQVEIESIEGNASLSRVGVVRVEQVEGNLAIAEAEEVTVGIVEGNGSIRTVTGAIMLDQVEGEITIKNPGPTVNVAHVEGNAALEGFLHAGGSYEISADGDIRLNVEGHARIVTRGASEVRTGSAVRQEGEPDAEWQTVYWVGEGENPAHVKLELGGGRLDLNLDDSQVRYTWGDDVRFGKDQAWSGEIHLEVEQALREAREEIRQAAETMRRELKQAMRKGGVIHTGIRGPLGDFLNALRPTPPAPPGAPEPPAPPSAPNRDELKLVLTMLQEGQISADEAERLIAALSGQPTS